MNKVTFIFLGLLLIASCVIPIYSLVGPTDPVINTDQIQFKSQPDNITIVEQGSTDMLTWQFNPGDVPAGTPYNITINSVLNKSGVISGNKADLDISTFSIGIYSVELILDEINNFTLTDTLQLQVIAQSSPIIISKSQNPIFESGSPAIQISWEVYDLSPNNYTVFQNGTEVIINQPWQSNTTIEVEVANLVTSANYTIILEDDFGLKTTSAIIVELVSNQAPVLVSSPGDLVISESTVNFTLSWIFEDITPDTYNITRNSIVVSSGFWSDAVPIEFNITESIGIYNYSITVSDLTNQTTTDDIIVEFKDLVQPTIIPSGSELQVPFDTRTEISWTIYDKFPGSYQILENRSLIQQGNWVNASVISIFVSESTPTTLNYTFIAFDQYGNQASNTILVTFYGLIDEQAPVFLLSPTDISTEYGSPALNLTWVIADETPDTYSLYQNDTIIDSGVWLSNVSISYLFENNEVGIFEIRIVVIDEFGNENSNQVMVTVQREINLEVVVQEKLKQNQNFVITVTSTFIDTDQLMLYQTNTDFSTMVTVSLAVTYMNGEQEVLMISKQVLIGDSSQFVYTRDSTRNIRSIEGIEILTSGSVLFPQVIYKVPRDNLPQIEPTGLLNSYRFKLYTSPVTTILLTVLIIGLLGSVIYWYRRLIYSLFLDIKLQIQKKPVGRQLDELKDIWVIIIKTRDGIPVYENSLMANLPDGALIAGLSSAVTNMLNEISDNNKTGFEMVERDDLSLLNHRLEGTDATIISARKLSDRYRERLASAHHKISELDWINKKVNKQRREQKQEITEIFIEEGIELQYLQAMSFSQEHYEEMIQDQSAPLRLLPLISRICEYCDKELSPPFTIHQFLEIPPVETIDKVVTLSIFKILVDNRVLKSEI